MIDQSPISFDPADCIDIIGAREHNLKNLSLSIPRNQFVVITGVSGSGKSTLAFDLLFAEGQRRFLDAMNTYARQFVDQLARPEVDLISGIPPTVSIEQRNSRGGGKSTVATVTEIYHFLRLLFARLGTVFCPDCQIAVEPQTGDEVARRLRKEVQSRGELRLLAPLVKNRKGFHSEIADWAASHGFAEIRADGQLRPSSEPLRLDRFREHNVEVVVGRITAGARPSSIGQLAARALELGKGTAFALDAQGQLTVHSTERACRSCGASFESLDPKLLSYNSPRGWCPTCRGFGELFYLPDVDRGARADAIEESWFDWQEGEREICSACSGLRLNPLARSIRLLLPSSIWKTGSGPNIADLSNMTVQEAQRFFAKLSFNAYQAEIARDILPEISERLRFLNEVGLEYLQLGRSVTTLSGGEAQRIRLAAQLGSNLSGVLYILDEPTIGLHSRDNERLLQALNTLKERGNSLLVVEHDEETMRNADYIIDLGPGAGILGGEVVAAGTLKQLKEHPNSITGRTLRQTKAYPSRGQRRPVLVKDKPMAQFLTLKGAQCNNLKSVTARFPLNRFVVVTGVSGSGKSTLVRECLLPSLEFEIAARKNRNRLSKPTNPKENSSRGNLDGANAIKAVYQVDQSPIGRTPRSVPATYVGFFDHIRQLFAQTPEAKMRGFNAGRFSFNSNTGRCSTCEGAGTVKLEMNFLPAAFVRCETCQGTRFSSETLEVEFRGKNIAQVLDLSVAEGIEFFSAFAKIHRPLQALRDTGLDYIKLGQISPTLSGGEAQRMKLVTHLLTGLRPPPDHLPTIHSKTAEPRSHLPLATPGSVFILEEPTIGLHMADVQKLVDVIHRLVDAGHTVIVIEHNLDLISEADWVIDLGPEAGQRGGEIIAEGTPEQIARTKSSHTGRFLKRILHNS